MQTVITIPGSRFCDMEGFYTTIYGLMNLYEDWIPSHNLDALNDMLYSGFGTEPVTIAWEDAEKSRVDLGVEATRDFYQQKINHGKPYNVTWAQEKLDELLSGDGQTLFDIIVEILNSHKHIQLELQ